MENNTEKKVIKIEDNQSVLLIEDQTKKKQPESIECSSKEPPSPNETADSENVVSKKNNISKRVEYTKLKLPNYNAGKDQYIVDILPLVQSSFFAKIENADSDTYTIEQAPDTCDLITITFDTQVKTISVTKATPGEYDLALIRSIVGKGFEEHHKLPLHLLVNHDPKDLWKNIPSDKTDPYYKPDTDSQFINWASKSFVAASKRGRSHAQDGRFRDDDFEIYFDSDQNYAIIAVADGAGSAKFSRKGSQIAVKTAVEQFKSQANKEFWERIEANIDKWKNGEEDGQNKLNAMLYNSIIVNSTFEAKKSIEVEKNKLSKLLSMTQSETNQNKLDIKDYATTLLLSIVRRVKQGWFIASYWVGDGCIGIYIPEENKVIIHGEPDGGTFGGQTRFLTMNEIWSGTYHDIVERRLRFDVVEDFFCIALMSDGITDPLFETDNNLKKIELWDSLWKNMSANVDFSARNDSTAQALLDWLDFWSPGDHDDRTIVIMY